MSARVVKEWITIFCLAVLPALLVVFGVNALFATGGRMHGEARLRLPDGSISGLVIGNGTGEILSTEVTGISHIYDHAVWLIPPSLTVDERSKLICLYADMLRKPGLTENEKREVVQSIETTLRAR